MAQNIDDFSSDYAGLTPIKVSHGSADDNQSQSTFGFKYEDLISPQEVEKNAKQGVLAYTQLLDNLLGNNTTYNDNLVLSSDKKGIQKDIYTIARREGLTHAQAVGILGNIAQESGFNINAKGDSGKSHGLFQMGKGEREQFASWKKANISRISDLPDYLAQVVYVCDMMKSNKYNAHGMDKKLAYAYWNSSDPAKTAQAFCAIYEKAGKPMMDNRIKYANKFNQLFSNFKS